MIYYDYNLLELYYENIGTLIGQKNNYSKVIIQTVLNLCSIFDFIPTILNSSDLDIENTQGPMKLVKICECIGASEYISGENGREYNIEESFTSSECNVLFHKFKYPEYIQYKSDSFLPWLAIFDIIFNCGIETVRKLIIEKPRLVL